VTGDSALRATVGFVAVAGTALSAYLTSVHYEPKALICTAGGGCEKVQESEYAVVAGVPVAVLGLAMWLTVIALVVWDAHVARVATAALGLASLAFAIYLLALQLFVIDALCVWCVVNDAALVPLLFAVSAIRLRTSFT
jgi:uncharacterized membrane protein